MRAAPNPEKFLRIFKETAEPGYDVETNGLDWKRGFVCGYSVSDGTDKEYIPVRHGGGHNIDQVDAFEADLAKAAKEHKGRIVGHNIKFDMHFSQNHGVFLGNKVADTMTMACLLDENRRGFSLKVVAKQYSDIEQKNDQELYSHLGQLFSCKPTRDSMGHFWRTAGNDPIALDYAEQDTVVTKQLWEKQKKQLYAENLDTVRDLENELTYVLQKMERRGIGVCPIERAAVVEKINDMFISAYIKIPVNEIDLTPINTRSGKELKDYFEMCDITDWPTTELGNPSFNKSFLALSQQGRDILNVRKLSHLRSSFLDVLDQHVYKDRIHTTFNQARGETHGTRGGRLSSSNPNKQQVPKRDKELGRIYRRMFKARPGYSIIEFDYSQAEPRLYTHYSSEPALLKGYTSNPIIDMHGVASQYMNTTRDIAKNLNLGIMYTMGPKKLAIQLGISYSEAMAIFKRWHATFPLVSQFTKKAEAVAQQRGYVRTILGRRRRFPNTDFCYRAANSIVQGGSADIMKWKIVQVDRYLEGNGLEEHCQMLLTIHDSLVFEISNDHLYILENIREILEDVQVAPFNLILPFKVDKGIGADWSTATYGEDKAVEVKPKPVVVSPSNIWSGSPVHLLLRANP